VVEMEFIQTDYFKYATDRVFDGVITDIPYKGCISNVFNEREFSFSTFLEKTDRETKKDAFLISFCNMLCFHDILNNIKETNWIYHTYQIWNKEPIRTWISWSHPLRTCEFIIYLKKGDFKYCFKNGIEKEGYKRSNFGGTLKNTSKNNNERSYGMFSEIIQTNKQTNNIPLKKRLSFLKYSLRLWGRINMYWIRSAVLEIYFITFQTHLE